MAINKQSYLSWSWLQRSSVLSKSHLFRVYLHFQNTASLGIMFDQINIKKVQDHAAIPVELLLLADPSSEMIDQYVHESCCFGAFFNNECIGVIVLYPLREEQLEIKNIAVAERFQGKGIGGILMNRALQYAQSRGDQSILIGTADTSLAQLNWYKKLGFKETHRKIDFFIEHYPQPIIENGQRCRDMIMLEKSLDR